MQELKRSFFRHSITKTIEQGFLKHQLYIAALLMKDRFPSYNGAVTAV
jgi:hypothetical protein